MLSLGGSTEQPLWLWWVRSLQCSRERGELYLTPDHLTPPPCSHSQADGRERPSETAASSSKQAANKPTKGNSHLVMLALSSASASL